MRTTLPAALCAAAATLLLGSGLAAAQPAPDVVGLSEQQAIALLDAEGIPYRITNRAGNLSGECRVTEQRDRGYRTEVDYVYDHDDDEFDRVERQVWLGVGLVVVCR